MDLELIALDKHWVRQIEAEGSASLSGSCSNYDLVAPFLEEAVDVYVALYKKTEAAAPWIAYLARVASTRAFVGICAFKTRPHAGRVEIACFTFQPYQRKGHGKAMSAQLLDLGFRHPDVSEIFAHTAPADNASAGILRDLGFVREADVDDPHDGLTRRWSLSRASHSQARITPLKRALAAMTMLT